MKLSKQALVLGVLSTALGLAKGRDVLKTLRGMKDDSTVHHLASEPASALMTKMSSIFSSCEGCVETASPSPHLVIHGGNPSSSNSSPVIPSSPGSSGGQPSPSNSSPASDGLVHSLSCMQAFDDSDLLLPLQEGKVTNRMVGCFKNTVSRDIDDVSEAEDPVEACSTYCDGDFFGLANDKTTCKCFSESPLHIRNPTVRLSLKSCRCTEAPDNEKMEVYFKSYYDDECTVDSSKPYRDQLVQEQGKQFGFDIISNTYMESPFKLTYNKCGTNVYKLTTFQDGGGGSMSTSMEGLQESAMTTRSDLSASISASAEADYDALFASVSGRVSASADVETSKEFSAKSSQSYNTQKFTSYGVHRVADLDIRDDAYVVEFKNDFADLLRDYKDNGYNKTMAKQLFDKYGMAVLGSGSIGGYISYTSTVSMGEVSGSYATTDKMKACFAASVGGSASYGKVSGSFSVDASGCTGTEKDAMDSWRKAYSEETSEENYVGGRSNNGDFEVAPDTAVLLKDKKYYRAGRSMGLRLLTDYLDPEKINPMQFRKHNITENELLEIRENLKAHVVLIMKEIGGEMDKCNPCDGTIYLTATDDGFTCKCYDPQLGKVDEPCEYSYECEGVCDVEAKVCKVPVMGNCTATSQCVGNPGHVQWYNICQDGKCRRDLGDPCQTSEECEICGFCSPPKRCCAPDSNGWKMCGGTKNCISDQFEDELLQEM